MALSKEIELPSGIIVNYHRVVSLNVVTNVQNIIEVASYTSKKKRQEEIDALKAAQNKVEGAQETNIYIETTYVACEYDQEMDIVKAYNWLKTSDDSFLKDGKDEE
jgi:heterodisulfide reductase subunit C